jgi:hypothetical protein
MSVLLYYDGLKELYHRLSDIIDISLEETVFTFITAAAEGYFDHLLTKTITHLKECK